MFSFDNMFIIFVFPVPGVFHFGSPGLGGQSRDKNHLLCTCIRTEPVSKLAISFLKLNGILRVKVQIPQNGSV